MIIRSLLLGLIASAAQASQPNIIFILTDDLGYGDLGVLYQNERAEAGMPHHLTPHLDRMAEGGLQMRRHYVSAPVCAPARASLLTGVHQGHAHVRDNQFDKALEENHTLGTVLREAGYATAVIGKWGLQGREGNSPGTWEAYPTKRGFDHFLGYVRHRDGHNHYPAHKAPQRPPVELYLGDQEISEQLDGSYTTDLFTAAAKQWIVTQRQERPDQPFFLYLAYDTPHAGLEVPAAPYPDGGGLHGGVQWIGEPGRMINTAREDVNSYIYPDYADQEWAGAYKRFATMVRRIDDSVGDLLQLLEDLEIEGETLIIFTSDNGPHAESYGYGGYRPAFLESFGPLDGIKRDCWEGGIRVPTLAYWPEKIPAGRIDDTPTQFHDWMPTFAEVAGLPAPARTDGVSLVPTLIGNGRQPESNVYIEYQVGGRTPDYDPFEEDRRNRRRGQMQVVYSGGYKGVRYRIESPNDDFLIYDTRNDPGETTNLANEGEEFRRLQQRMKERVLQVRRPNPTAPRPYDDVPVPAVSVPDDRPPGLAFTAFEVKTPWTPDVKTLRTAPGQSGTVGGFDLGVRTRENHIVVQFAGLLRAPETGEYTFWLQTDRGAVMRLHEATVLDADGGYPSGSEQSATIHLEKGFHPVHLVYARGEEGQPLLRMHWAGPGLPKTEIAPGFLSHAPSAGKEKAAATARVPADYQLLYEQNFDAPEAINGFIVSDPKAWKLSRHEHGLALHQAVQSNYTPPVRSPRTVGLIADKLFGDFILEADLLSTGNEVPHRDLCLFFGFQDPARFYYIHIASQGDEVAHQMHIVNNEPRVKITQTRNDGVEWGDGWHRIRLERTTTDGLIRLFFDDMAEPIMEARDTTFESGYIGFGSFDDTGLFDNIRVWGPDMETKRASFFARPLAGAN